MKADKNIYSVGQVNNYIKSLLRDDFVLSNLYIKGELSNLKYHSSGHIYFSLKDETGVIAGVMWASDASRLKIRLQDGMKVVIHGSIGVYEIAGKYQIYAKSIEEEGIGDLAKAFEELKNRLEESGMFSDEYKKTIPTFGYKIGVVTAQTGAVIQDIFNVASRRNPYSQIYLYPAQVQGEGAANTIVSGIKYLDSMTLDVIIIGRGGGSLEDLWPFNEEIVARAIFNASTPIISAVGHETDFTIADFVSDLRAPTPSAAAELAVFDYNAFQNDLASYEYTLKREFDSKLNKVKSLVENYKLKVESLSPENKILLQKNRLDEISKNLKYLIGDKLNSYKENFSLYAEKLEGRSPLKRFSQGYVFAVDKNKKPLKSINQIEIDDVLNINVTDGQIETKVISKKEVSYE